MRLLFDAMDRSPSLSGKDFGRCDCRNEELPGVTGTITIDAQRNANKDAVMRNHAACRSMQPPSRLPTDATAFKAVA
jgi:hypothetical protein